MFGFEGDAATMWIWLGAMIPAGIVAGLLAGLLGVGGGIVIVPVLYSLLTALDIDPDVRMHVAVGTSLATIIVTSVSSVRSHNKRGAVDFALLKSWGPAIFVGVLIGTVLAGYVDGEVLTAVFGVTALVVALNMLLRRAGARLRDDFPNAPVKGLLGVAIGTISTMMGIGGGTLSVPILSAFGYEMRRAVGTASAIGFIIAIPGTIGFILFGLGEPGRPPFSLGYVNLAAAALLIPITTLAAPYGARIAHAIPQRALQLCFAFFLAVTGGRMLYGLWA
jgi:uncharacterized membrane protein YfcA